MSTQIRQHQAGRTASEPHEINVFDRARAATIAMVERVAYPHRGIANRLAMVMRDILTCADHGFNENELRLLSMALDGVIDDRFHPLADEQMTRRLESEADRKEDATNDRTIIDGETPALLEQHARDLDAQASSSRALARSLRAKARKLRTDRERSISIAKERLGLNPQER